MTQQTLVVKIGGGAGLDMERCALDLARIAAVRPLVVVHGVSDALNHLCEERGVPVRTITSPTGHTSRYTDPPTRDLFVQAAESVNADLVARLRGLGVNAVGMTGENVVIHGERKNATRAVVDGRIRVIRDDYSGSITHVDQERTQYIVSLQAIPILPPLAISPDGLLNIDGDRAAAAVAAALGAAELVILSNVRGLYRVWGDEDSLVRQVERREIDRAMDWAQGRMKRKVLGAKEALEGGVLRAVIADGRVDMPVSHALAGYGTRFE